MNKYNDFSNLIQNDLEESLIFQAYKISSLDYTKDSIFRILSENDIETKIFALINLKSIDTKKEALILINHLTGQDGRIREAVSFILGEIDGLYNFYTDEESLKILTNGLLDINPNVARNIISFIEKNPPIKQLISPFIFSKTRKTLDELSSFIKEDFKFKNNRSKSFKNHAKNKLTFNLYWLLSAISTLDNIYDIDDILTNCADFLDYTIREKTALIISKMDNPPYETLQKLKNDVNIYVKKQLL